MICHMRSRVSRTTIVLILLTCLVSPLVEMFDSWDHTLQTGNDTEYALVVLALCVGLVYSLASIIFTSSVAWSLRGNVFAAFAHKSLLLARRSFALVFFSSSSPPPPLRV